MSAFKARPVLFTAMIGLAVACALLLAYQIRRARFEHAIVSHDIAAVRDIIDAGADIDSPFVHRSLVRRLLGGHFTRYTPPLVLASENDADIAGLLIDAGADVNVERSDDGITPLMAAARSNELATAQALLRAGANIDTVSGRYPCTALSLAATAGGFETVQLLLDNGASLRAGGWLSETSKIEPPDFAGNHLVSKVIKHAWLSSEPAMGSHAPPAWTPLMNAARFGHIEDCRAAVEDAPDVDMQDDDGWTALMWAASPVRDSARKTELLLGSGATPSIASAYGWTALMSAALGDETATVQALLRAGAPVDQTDSACGLRALNLAVYWGTADIVGEIASASEARIHHDQAKGLLSLAQHNRRGQAEAILIHLRPYVDRMAPSASIAQRVVLTNAADPYAAAGDPSIGEAGCRRTMSGREWYGSVWISNPTIDLAFDIVWRAEGSETTVGALIARPGDVRAFFYRAPASACPDTIDVVLRPSAALVERDGVTSAILGDEVVLSGVRVDD